MAQSTATSQKTFSPASLLNLLTVYLVWGSTYLAIRIAVREGSGFPPFTMGLMRVLAAGGILLLWAKFLKQRLRPTRHEWLTVISSGLLLWTGGNGLVIWAEQHADSGLAALIVASSPVWTAIIETFVDRKPPSAPLILSLLVGFTGIGLLAAPSLGSGLRADALSTLALVLAAVSWSAGSVFQARRKVSLPPRVNSAYQMLAGGIGFLILRSLMGEPLPAPTTEAWLAWGYLVLFGSVLAFTAYVTILRQMPTSIVMTSAYVNPVIAVVLGWLILDEEITLWTVGGSLLVLLGVYGVFRQRKY